MNANRLQAPVRFARFLAVLGVASSILLAAVLLLAAFARANVLAATSIRGLGREDTLEHLIIAAVAHADALLIATALLIIGIGLYSIFIGRVERLPHWLAITGIDDLKDKLAGASSSRSPSASSPSRSSGPGPATSLPSASPLRPSWRV